MSTNASSLCRAKHDNLVDVEERLSDQQLERQEFFAVIGVIVGKDQRVAADLFSFYRDDVLMR